MQLVYIANEVSDDTLGVFKQIRAEYPSVITISDNSNTNYDKYLAERKNKSESLFVIVYLKHEAPLNESFINLCSLGLAGILPSAKYVLFYDPDETPFERFINYIDECTMSQ